jgi:protein-tyrosine-phosphatase
VHKPFNVLFLCTGNSARSVLAEAILNRIGKGKFVAYSAGSQPKGAVNPHTLSLLKGLGYDTSGFRSKSWSEFAKPGAPEFDFIFTASRIQQRSPARKWKSPRRFAKPIGSCIGASKYSRSCRSADWIT